MSTDDHRDSARKRKPQSRSRRLKPGEYLTRKEAMQVMGCDKTTFARWLKEKELVVYCPRTRRQWVISDDLMALIKRHPLN